MRYFILLASMAILPVLHAEEIACTGVIGNSGGRGKGIVRFDKEPARGIGVVYDRFGTLWDRGGAGMLNRYAVDGRMVAQYPIQPSTDRFDKMALCGDTIILKLRGHLYKLSVDAKAGTAPVKLNIEAMGISFGTSVGKIAVIDKNGELHLLSPDGTVEKIGALQIKDVQGVEMASDGTVYVTASGNMHKVVKGKVVPGWERKMPGERAQLIDGVWYGHAWHGTIRRFDADLQPDPGVVLGGASGSFIGHLAQNSELSNGRGMAKLNSTLFAVSGIEGVLHLLAWDGKTRKMTIIRRIGAMPTVNGMGLDREGRIWAIAGSWEWTSRPDTPMEFGVNVPEHPGIGQAVMFPDDNILAAGFIWGKPAFFYGTFDSEIQTHRVDQGCNLRTGMIGAAVYRQSDKRTMLVVDANGKAQSFHIHGDGKFAGNGGDVQLTVSKSTMNWTSLAMKDENTLLAGAGGFVIEFQRDGNNWKERFRWNKWGGDKFGDSINLCVDDGRLWITDTARHRCICFDPKSSKPLAILGTADKPGTSLIQFDRPTTIIARGRYAAVFDSGNQRIMKLKLK